MEVQIRIRKCTLGYGSAHQDKETILYETARLHGATNP